MKLGYMAINRTKTHSNRAKTRKPSRTALRKSNRTIWFLGAMAALILCAFIILHMGISNKRNIKSFSSQVRDYEPLIEKYAEEAGIPDYKDYLMAIMQVETGGMGQDVMQSSESLGMPRNSLNPEESIRQGCAYLAENLARADQLGCDTLSAVQAYNYGIDYLNFVAERGGIEDVSIAEEFAKMKSGGKTVKYSNKVAREYNGGYRYQYGNMFYAEIVKRLLESVKS